jgi:hypothetical protein
MLYDAMEPALERSLQELADGVMNCMVGRVCNELCTYEATGLSTHMFSVAGQAIRVGTCLRGFDWAI